MMTDVPPANSIPSGIPFVKKTNAPARMTAHDSTSAWARHFRKSKFVFLKMCMTLDTQRRDLLPIRVRHLEQRLRHEDRREEVRHQSVEQRDGEAANRPGPE